jgi:hypothetical protein
VYPAISRALGDYTSSNPTLADFSFVLRATGLFGAFVFFFFVF